MFTHWFAEACACLACVASAKGKGEREREREGGGGQKIREKKEGRRERTGEERREGTLAATLLFSSFIRSQANVKIPLAKRCDDCQSRNISYCACCFANRDGGGRFVRAVQLKTDQLKGLQQLYDRKDLIAVLPTGYGKSLIFQLLVLLASKNGITIHLSFNCKCSRRLSVDEHNQRTDN